MKISKEVLAYDAIKYIVSELKPYEVVAKREFFMALKDLGYVNRQIIKNLDKASGKNGDRAYQILMEEGHVFSVIPILVEKPILPDKVEIKLEKILLNFRNGKWY